jgi:hypothetical protein
MFLSANCKSQNISHTHLACLLLLILNIEIHHTLIQHRQPSVCLVLDAKNNFIYQTSNDYMAENTQTSKQYTIASHGCRQDQQPPVEQINKESKSARPKPAAMTPSLHPGHLYSISPIQEGARSCFIDHAVHLLVPIYCFWDTHASPGTFTSSSQSERRETCFCYTTSFKPGQGVWPKFHE